MRKDQYLGPGLNSGTSFATQVVEVFYNEALDPHLKILAVDEVVVGMLLDIFSYLRLTEIPRRWFLALMMMDWLANQDPFGWSTLHSWEHSATMRP